MRTVNFQCGHCGKLMGVPDTLLGQQVRCPHCLQVVLAPAPAPGAAPAAPPPAATQRAEDLESIFAAESDSALFGGPEKPLIEMPPEPPPVVPAAREPVAAVVAEHTLEPTVMYDAASPLRHDTGFQLTEVVVPPPEPPAPSEPPALEAAPEPLTGVAPMSAVRPARDGSMFIALVLIPLISYSILATIAVLILYFRPAPPDPLEQILDIEGDFRGATHQKQGAFSYERIHPDRDLPRKLRVALGTTLRLGDLEVTPEKVELRRIVFHSPGYNPEKGVDDSLVLRLRLKNVSEDVVFCPTDPYFERRWKPGQSLSSKPYMFLDVGTQRFYGGPVPWRRGLTREARETIEGQVHKVLRPGDETTTFVCTAPEDHVGKALASYTGPLLWRVQLRRGLVAVRDREAPVTAVIGVEFPASAVARPAS